MLEEVRLPPKERIETETPDYAKEQRIKEKKQRSETKKHRKESSRDYDD